MDGVREAETHQRYTMLELVPFKVPVSLLFQRFASGERNTITIL